jgi:hypothetical protein
MSEFDQLDALDVPVADVREMPGAALRLPEGRASA